MPRERAPAPRPARPRLVVFSPLPPMPTGIGDYSYELLPGLAAAYDITVVTEDQAMPLRAPAGICQIPLCEYHPPAHADATHLYMLGNNPDHLYLLPTLARQPGVVVVHDPGLHHLLDCATASLGDIDGYCAAVEAEYGAPGRLLAEQWRRHHLRDRQMLYDMPMLRQLLGPARHAIVHSRFAAHKVLSQAPHVPVTIAPHPYAPPPSWTGRAQMRARLGIGQTELVFLSLGFVSHIKRIDTALRALARIAARLPPFRYVIAGELKPDELDVAGLARTLGLADHVMVTGFVAEDDFFAVLGLADVVINLRHPMGGETSGTLIRALGGGACVVVVDDGPFAEIPDGAAVKLPWSVDFETVLADALLRLAISPAARAQIGAAAAADTARRHHPARTLAAYRAAIDAATATRDRPWRSNVTQGFQPPQHCVPVGAPLWLRLDAVPAFLSAADVLARGDAADLAALRALGHTPRRLGAAWKPAAEPPRCADLVFLGLGPVEAARLDADFLAALNRLLRFGGVLALQLRDVDLGISPLAARRRGQAALHAAGFRVDLAGAAAPPLLAAAAVAETDGMVWRAIKVSEFFAITAAAVTGAVARAAVLLAADPAACAVVAEPAGADFAVSLATRIGGTRVFGYRPAALGDVDADLLSATDSLWPGSATPTRTRQRRIDRLHHGQTVGLLALHHDTAIAALRGAADTLDRCRPVVLLDLRGRAQPATLIAAAGALLTGYEWPKSASESCWALPRGRKLPAGRSTGRGAIAVAFDHSLACEGIHAPEFDAPGGGRWTGAAAATRVWLPRPRSGTWTLRLAVADWGNAAGGFAIRADGQRLQPSQVDEHGASYGPFRPDPAGGAVLLIELFTPRPVPDHDRWPRKIGVRLLAATLSAR